MLAKKSSALGAAFLIGLTAASVATAQAQNPAPTPPDSQRVERQRVERREARRDQERRVAGRDDRVRRAGKSRMGMLFRGVEVTDAQPTLRGAQEDPPRLEGGERRPRYRHAPSDRGAGTGGARRAAGDPDAGAARGLRCERGGHA